MNDEQQAAHKEEDVSLPPNSPLRAQFKKWRRKHTVIVLSVAAIGLWLTCTFMVGVLSGRNSAVTKQSGYDTASDAEWQKQFTPELEKAEDKPAEPKQTPEELPDFSLSMQYPVGWKVATTAGSRGTNTYETTTTATSPTGTVLTAMVWYGGLGGDCRPGPNDKPHQKGNLCPTAEILSKEPLGSLLQYKEKTYPLYLVTRKLTATDGKATYMIGVLSDTDSEAVEVNKPYMGLVLAYLGINTSGPTLSIYATSTDGAFLTNTEGQQVKEALKTLKFANDGTLYPGIGSSIQIP